jgi:hypothetical protein
MSPEARRYSEQVLAWYRLTPNTLGHLRPADRRLALRLFDQQVPLEIIAQALLAATGRRAGRPEDAPPLARIASLHYFVPIIDELIEANSPYYLDHLMRRVAPFAPQLAAAIKQQLS